MTPLMYAASAAKTYVVEYLLSCKADVNKASQRRFTVLRTAMGSHPEEPRLLQVLLQAGADVNAEDHTGCTALRKCLMRMWHQRAQKPHRYRAHAAAPIYLTCILPYLMSSLSDERWKGLLSCTDLHSHLLWRTHLMRADILAMCDKAEHAAARMRDLLAAGANIHARSKNGMTPLIWASHTGNVHAVR